MVGAVAIAVTVVAGVVGAFEFGKVSKGGVGAVILAVTVAVGEVEHMEDVGALALAETIAVGAVGAIVVDVVGLKAVTAG